MGAWSPAALGSFVAASVSASGAVGPEWIAAKGAGKAVSPTTGEQG